MPPMISAAAVTKRYKTGGLALDAVDLAIERGEIFALLGPNGAGKTTLIGVICGTVSMTSGKAYVDGYDVTRDFRAARSKVGLVPQEIALDIFATVWATVSSAGACSAGRPIRTSSSAFCAISRCGRSAMPGSSNCPGA